MLNVPGYVWDATCVLTLAALARPGKVISTLRHPSYVERSVLHGEVIYVRPWRDEEALSGKILVDADRLAADAQLQIIDMTEEEVELHVQFAADVDDGEARSAAVAYKRGMALVTDDREALRLCRSLTPPILTLQTPDWLHFWASKSRIILSSLDESIQRIEIKAHYLPARNHPLHSWWINRGRAV